MANTLTMADLLAKEESKQGSSSNRKLSISRGQELEGEVVLITPKEIILDLGVKAEGVLPVRDLPQDQQKSLKIGDKIKVFVNLTENESGQVVLGLHKATSKGASGAKWDKFEAAINSNRTFNGRGIEVNKGGLIVEVGEIRGFLPSSQVSLSQVASIEDLVGKDILVTVIEVDPNQNRLIFSQKTNVSEEVKDTLSKISVGDKVSGKVAAVLPFGVFITLEDHSSPASRQGGRGEAGGVEGLVHISELSWEKVEEPGKLYKIGDKVEAIVTSVDPNTNRVNLSIKQMQKDPFETQSKKYSKDDVIKGSISKITSMGLFISLEAGLEGLMPASKMDTTKQYEIGQTITATIDNIDIVKRRIYLVPFITSTKDLIYK